MERFVQTLFSVFIYKKHPLHFFLAPLLRLEFRQIVVLRDSLKVFQREIFPNQITIQAQKDQLKFLRK